MKKLLIATEEPLGYQTDFFNWCLNLNSVYSITYLCFTSNLPLISVTNVNVIQIDTNAGRIKKEILYFKKAKLLIKHGNYNNIIVTNNKRSTLLKLVFKDKKVIHDIRTIAVFQEKWKKIAFNLNWFIGALVYTQNTIITESIAEFYRIPYRKYSVLPLGANIISKQNKNFEVFNLLYIGVIRDNFIESIKGFAKFIKNNKYATYTIIGYNDGSSSSDTVLKLKETIVDLQVEKYVRYVGRKNHFESIEFFDSCNVGVSFIPTLKHFDNQPPTKNYEYLLSGMICIATSTSANKKIINDENGIIVNDNSDSFAEGLNILYENRLKFNSFKIRQSQLNHQWSNIVEKSLKPVLNKFDNL